MALRGGIGVVLVVLVGCAARGPSQEQMADPRLVEIDQRWASRGMSGLDQIEALLFGADEPEQPTPEWMWRQVRHRAVQGQGMEDQPRLALQRYGEARELGMRCLDQVPSFQQIRREEGLKAAAAAIPPEYAGCATWTSLAWARWLALFGGDAGALDVEGVEALSTMAARVGGESFRSEALWAQAVTVAIRPKWLQGDPQTARRLMKEVVDMAPQERLRQWDYMSLVALPDGDAVLVDELRESIERSAERTPEDAVAKTLVAQAVANGAIPGPTE